VGTTGAERIIDEFMAAWERADVDELLDYFSEDAVWHRFPCDTPATTPTGCALKPGGTA